MKNITIFNNIKSTLNFTKNTFLKKITTLFNKKDNSFIIENLYKIMLEADIGVKTTDQILTTLSNNIKKNNIKSNKDILLTLSNILTEILLPYEKNLTIDHTKKPFVILVVGINGSGKTTTIGKLANLYINNNKKVLIAAGDTYRAAAIEQLQEISKKINVQIISQHYGADSASVIFDAYKAAIKKNIDVLIADTAGRLHTNDILMKELKKIKNVLQKINPLIPHEIILTIDANLGQNSLNQAKYFNNLLNVNSIAITKLDGTAKAGIIFAITSTLNIPVQYICFGEKIDNIKEFKAKDFVSRLLNI